MADQTKLEEMLERLINGDKEGAEELFHEYTIQKSREIYESLLEDDAEDEEVDEAAEDDDEEVEEAAKDDDDEIEEGFDLEEFEVEADDEEDPMAAMMGGDETDDMMGDIEGGDEEGEEEGEEGDMEDRVEDLEDALDELKAEFEKLMAGEEGDDESDMDMDMDMGGDEEEPEEESFTFEADKEEDKDGDGKDDKSGKPMTKGAKSAGEQMREYVEKVTAKMGDNGANTKSIVAGANDMGGTAGNIAQAGTEAGVEANKGQLKGNGVLKGTAKEENMGNVNVPGGKASKSMTAMPKGHGAEKKGAGEQAANKKSTLGS